MVTMRSGPCAARPAERGAIHVYNELAQKTFGKDPVTYNLMVHILEEEVDHKEDFESLLE